jgi:hypothetical protein
MFVSAVWVAGNLDVPGKRKNLVISDSKSDDAIRIGSEEAISSTLS